MEQTEKGALMSIGELARRAGVSARMLRHYDEIGLLRPERVTQAGYRLYGEASLLRLTHIRYLRELEFSLPEIARMLDGAQRETQLALSRHRELMLCRRAQIDAIIARLDGAIAGKPLAPKEESIMNQWEEIRRQYADEARARWGDTEAYRESERREEAATARQRQEALDGMNAILQAFADARTLDASHARAQALVARLKAHITENYYDCTDEILAGLGAMYVQDERFTKNIDRFGEGTAAFMSRAIARYCEAGKA